MFRRIFPTIFIVAASSLFAFIALAVLQFNQVRFELERERIAVLANRTADPFKAATQIGLPVSSVRNTAALLELARQFDPAIEGAYLFAADGSLVASTTSTDREPALLGGPFGLGDDASATWSGDTTDGFYSGVRLFDASGRVAGGVAITYSGRQSQAQSWAMVGQLLLAGLAFTMVLAPAIWIVLRRALARATTAYDEVEEQIQRFERESWLSRISASTGEASRPSASARPLSALIGEVERRYALEIEGSAGTPARTQTPTPDDQPMAPPAQIQALRRRIVLAMLAVVSSSLLVFSTLVVLAFDRAIEPELESRATLIGSLVRAEMQRTLELGIPMSALGGLSPHFEGILENFDEVSAISLISGGGERVAEARREDTGDEVIPSSFGHAVGVRASTVEMPVLAGSQVVGTIRIEGSQRFVQTRLRDVVLDVSILAIAMLLIGVELAIAIASATVWKPHAQLIQMLAEQRKGQFNHVMREQGPVAFRRLAARFNSYALDIAKRRRALGNDQPPASPKLVEMSDRADIRLPLFLFALGSEITASFLPVYASAATRPVWLTAEVAAAAPMVIYLLAVAALSPFAGAISRRYGAARLFLASVPVAMAALVWMAMAGSVTQIALARGLVAACYALVTVACQEYGLRVDPAAPRARTMSGFIGVIIGGTFCGSVIGGVLASRLGFPSAIMLGAVFILASGLACRLWMIGPAGAPSDTVAAERVEEATPVDMRRFAALVVGLAMPLSAVTAAFIWYYMPLALDAQGLRSADVARVVMLYYLAAIILGPMMGTGDRGGHGSGVSAVVGAVLSGLTLVALPFLGGVWIAACAVLLVGIGHTLLRSPIYALTLGLSGASSRPIALLRLFERLGAILGLSIAAALGQLGYHSTISTALGLAAMAGAVLFVISEASVASRARRGHPC
ncbi:MFS transporter [Defluviimonas sp. WL0002]|uniref:MFS transporter n=1 Tax=Albidovulum marisflavi TaxID=2984159 RepID=A0ABT2ZEN9_9RHOB|nr:MFS transporter [Defluviimonas sp. WL0002]MCV2869610.1 MFS transporter [Defluviimonas sp. WL0002]